MTTVNIEHKLADKADELLIAGKIEDALHLLDSNDYLLTDDDDQFIIEHVNELRPTDELRRLTFKNGEWAYTVGGVSKMKRLSQLYIIFEDEVINGATPPRQDIEKIEGIYADACGYAMNVYKCEDGVFAGGDVHLSYEWDELLKRARKDEQTGLICVNW